MRTALFIGIILLLPFAASGHVGSPDVYFDGQAGPYHLLVTIRPPAVIPGVAEIEVRTLSNDVNQVEVLPLRMTGIGARLAPHPDVAERSSTDRQLYRGKLWLMVRGAWKVQVNVDGAQGKAQLAVPVAAVSNISPPMKNVLGLLLSVLGVFLVAGLIGIVRAANAEADLDAGEMPSQEQRTKGVKAAAFVATLIVIVLFFGNLWWKSEEKVNAELAYQLPHVEMSADAAGVLRLKLPVPQTMEKISQFRVETQDRLRIDDLLPDHGHLMHLFLVSTPQMTSFWHLHPQQEEAGEFSQMLPAMPAGHYKIFADVVHATGFAETYVGDLRLGAINRNANSEVKPNQEDDAGVADMPASDKISSLPDGYQMVWEKGAAPLKARTATWFRFRLQDASGKPASGMEDYMGMAGHAVFVSDDGNIFAHVHPAGSVSMAAAELAQGDPAAKTMSTMPMPGHNPSAEVTFPYGFPQPGSYHIFVQVRRAGHIETGVFAAKAE